VLEQGLNGTIIYHFNRKKADARLDTRQLADAAGVCGKQENPLFEYSVAADIGNRIPDYAAELTRIWDTKAPNIIYHKNDGLFVHICSMTRLQT